MCSDPGKKAINAINKGGGVELFWYGARVCGPKTLKTSHFQSFSSVFHFIQLIVFGMLLLVNATTFSN
jgi:hypothetical protein